MPASSEAHRGYAILDALVAMALFAWAAVAAGALVHGAVGRSREAARLDTARVAAETVVARLEGDTWRGLPGVFGAGESDAEAALDTRDGTAPSGWSGLVSTLPDGRLTARLTGLGEKGVLASFDAAIAMRVRVEVTYRRGPGFRRTVRLATVRF